MVRKVIHLVSGTFAAVAAIGIVVLMGITTVDVVKRELTGQGLAKSVEFAPLLLVAAVALGLGYAEWSGTHVRTTLVTDRLNARAAAVLHLVGLAVGLVMLVWITYLSFDRAMTAIDTDEVTGGFARVETWWARLIIPIGMVVFACEIVLRMLDTVAALRRGSEPPVAPPADAAAAGVAPEEPTR